MKNISEKIVILPIVLFIIILNIWSCEKESETIHLEGKKVYTVSDFTEIEGRAGYYPFHFPFSVVDYDLLNLVVTPYNHTEVIRINYERKTNDQSVFLGNIFMPYYITYHFANGNDTTVVRNAPEYLGLKAQRVPNQIDNQLAASNPESWVEYARTKKYDNPYLPYCGINRSRFYFNLKNSSGQRFTEQIEPDCTNWIKIKFIL